MRAWTYRNKNQKWRYLEMADCRTTWKRYRRAIFCRTLAEKGQCVLDFACTESILYTNLAPFTEYGNKLEDDGHSDYLEAKSIIRYYHDRGCDLPRAAMFWTSLPT